MKDAREIKGTIHIIQDADPSKTPEVLMEGEWTHRQIVSLEQFIFKAFRSYMAQKRIDGIKETSDDSTE